MAKNEKLSDLRGRIFQTTKRKTKTAEYNGDVFELRAPTNAQRTDLAEKCIIDGKVNNLKWMILTVIELTYIPGTDEKVFTTEDYDGLANMEAGGLLDVLSDAANELLNISIETKKKS